MSLKGPDGDLIPETNVCDYQMQKSVCWQLKRMDVDQYVFVIVVLEASLFANTLLIAAVPF